MPTPGKGVGNNLVIAYILLVGLPLLGLFSILEAGRGMVPAPSVSGEWVLDLDAGAASTCLGPLTAEQRPVMNVSQSGPIVTLSFNQSPKTRIMGNLEGNRLTGTTLAPTPEGCPEGAHMHLEATVRGKRGQHSLDGRLSWDGCGSCGLVGFRAEKQNSLRWPGL